MTLFRMIFNFIFLLLPFYLFSSTNHHDIYFQQHVDYKINAELNGQDKIIRASETMIYSNESPDTLKNVYFYLYMNKYRAGALHTYRPMPVDHGYIEIDQLKINGHPHQDYSIDNTIMKVILPKALAPDDSIKFIFQFEVKLPPASGRYGIMGDHYDVGNWFPTPVVYDRAGWHLHQHLDNEFYQEWADFRVDIRVPKGFIVGATGDLLNPETALKDTSQAIRDYYFNNPEDTSTTLWQFEANMVHDFAWTADPEYVLMQSEWNGITFNVLAMSANVESWRQVTDWGSKALQFYYQTYGPYPYKQLTVADTYIRAGGIEYPNIVFINTGISPEFRLNYFKAVVVHEMAHNWFYGLLANNQTEEEWMDEGFTSFAEIECMEALFGIEDNYSNNRDDWFSKIFWFENNDRRDNALSYLELTKEGRETDQIDLHPDYLGYSAYISQYSKMADVIYMLEYVLGDSVFDIAIKNYFNEWHFKHPYRSDMIASFEKTANRDLDWFFEQWLETTWQLDYAVDLIQGSWQTVVNGDKMYKANIDIKNLNKIFMPIDLDITLKNGKQVHYHIPIDNSAKEEKDRKILPYWHFSKKKYRATVELEDEIDFVEIDASQRLMDVNRLNNRSGLLPEMDFVFMRPQSIAPPLGAYLWEGWPLVFYNDKDIAKIGFKLEGGYLDMEHLMNLGVSYKTATGNVDYDLKYKHPFGWMGMNSWTGIRAYTLDGVQGMDINLEKLLIKNRYRDPFYTFLLDLTTYSRFDNDYALSVWNRGTVNTLNLQWARELDQYWTKHTKLSVSLLNSIMGSDYNFTVAELNWMAYFYDFLPDVNLLFNIKAGFSEGDVPIQHLFYLNGINGWSMFNSPWYRAKGSLPYPWFREGHLYMDQGAMVRGYGLFPDDTNLSGKKMIIFSSDVTLPNPLAISPVIFIRDIVPSIFFDYGYVWDNSFPGFKDMRNDTGFSLAWNRFPSVLTYLTSIDKVQFDFPLFMSHVPDGKKHWDFRWLVRFDFDLDE